MGASDRDWYRERAEDTRPVITIRLRRRRWLRWAVPSGAVLLLLGGVAYQGLRPKQVVQPASKPEAAHAEPALPPAADAVAFPKDGYTVVSRHPGAGWNSPLTLRTPADSPYRHWLVSLRDWATGRWVATVYLSQNAITTVFLPAGFYRVAMAAGSNWQGETRLFGAGTQAWEWTSAVPVSPKDRPVAGPPTDAAENVVALTPEAFRTR